MRRRVHLIPFPGPDFVAPALLPVAGGPGDWEPKLYVRIYLFIVRIQTGESSWMRVRPPALLLGWLPRSIPAAHSNTRGGDE